MKAKEAIMILESIQPSCGEKYSFSESEIYEAIDMAIEALNHSEIPNGSGKDTNVPSNNILRHPSCKNRTSLGNCDPVGGFCSSVPKDICAKYYVIDTNVGDMISKQATITEIKNYERDSTAPIDYVKIVEQMPPAQPDARYINANELIKRLQQAGLDDAVSIAVKMAGHERLKHVPSAQPSNRACLGCKHLPRYSRETPCVNCSNNYVNRWERNDKTNS